MIIKKKEQKYLPLMAKAHEEAWVNASEHGVSLGGPILSCWPGLQCKGEDQSFWKASEESEGLRKQKSLAKGPKGHVNKTYLALWSTSGLSKPTNIILSSSGGLEFSMSTGLVRTIWEEDAAWEDWEDFEVTDCCFIIFWVEKDGPVCWVVKDVENLGKGGLEMLNSIESEAQTLDDVVLAAGLAAEVIHCWGTGIAVFRGGGADIWTCNSGSGEGNSVSRGTGWRLGIEYLCWEERRCVRTTRLGLGNNCHIAWWTSSLNLSPDSSMSSLFTNGKQANNAYFTLFHAAFLIPADGVYTIMSTDYVSFSIIHCLARLVFLHSFIPNSVVDYLSNSPFDSYHYLSPNNSQDEASL